MTLTPIKRKLRSYQRRMRQSHMVARAIKSKHHPILAHIIPMRRCNLSCAYCNEYDKVSDPVPTAEMLRRVELLAGLGTSIITISGGEPLLHPELDQIIRAIRSHGAIATIITNGYLLTPERIERLNRAGLEHLQISIDNVMPDEVSKKSLKVLDRKLPLAGGTRRIRCQHQFRARRRRFPSRRCPHHHSPGVGAGVRNHGGHHP